MHRFQAGCFRPLPQARFPSSPQLRTRLRLPRLHPEEAPQSAFRERLRSALRRPEMLAVPSAVITIEY